MKIEIYQSIPAQAAEIRRKVFVEEQGFNNEFDDTDMIAVHFVVFDELNTPVATCRVFKGQDEKTYILGRLAVVKEYRGKKLGGLLVKKAIDYVEKMGGKELRLHAQCRISGFYNKLGFYEFGDVEDDEGCPHIWMRKTL